MMNENQAGYACAIEDQPLADDPGPTRRLGASVRIARPGPLQVGDVLENCRLIAHLGDGSSGHTFLARETDLADRPIVLKVAIDNHDESTNLARLQHTHIMPLFWVRTLFPDGLRVLAMPYLAKTTLATLLSRMEAIPPALRTGARVFDVLQEDQDGLPVRIPADDAAAHVLKNSTWVDFVVRLGRALAEALAFAHQRNLLHLDIKPANIVLTPDGQPILLDLDVARPPLEAGETAVPWLGGTLAYISPEQKAAMHALKRDLPIPCRVDGRTDMYSLALVLYQALGGNGDCRHRPDPKLLPRLNPHVCADLANILARCLESDPARRYPDCAALAEDLDRHLHDLPARGARTSLRERWCKWRRRQPFGLPLAGLLIGFCIAAGLAGLNLVRVNGQRKAEAEAALVEGQDWQSKGHHEAAVRRFLAGKELADSAPGNTALRAELSRRLHNAKRLQCAGELSKTVHVMRLHALQEESPPRRLEHVLDAAGRNIWARRELLRDRSAGTLGLARERDIDNQLQELVLLWGDMQVRLAPSTHKERVRAEVRKTIDEAEQIYGSTFVLQLARERCGCGPIPAQRAQPRAGWELCAAGRSDLARGDVASAVRQFQQALEREPLAYVTNLHLSVGLLRQAQYAQALPGLSYCLGIDPSAECLQLRGEVSVGIGHLDDALRDFNAALEKNASLASAYEQRGKVLLKLGRHDESTRDLEFARKLRAPWAAPSPSLTR